MAGSCRCLADRRAAERLRHQGGPGGEAAHDLDRPGRGYEADVARFVDGIVGDDALAAHVASWVAQTAPPARVAHLGQKLLQLVVPGVPDVYQGTEFVDLSLVDPDNRRLVDYTARRTRSPGSTRGSRQRVWTRRSCS